MYKQSSISLVNDNLDEITLLKWSLKVHQEVCQINFMGDGTDFVEQFDRNPSGLILLDLHMPNIDGFAVIKEVRTKSNYRRTPIVVYSASTDISEIERCYDLGANSFVKKDLSHLALKNDLECLCSYWFKLAYLLP